MDLRDHGIIALILIIVHYLSLLSALPPNLNYKFFLSSFVDSPQFEKDGYVVLEDFFKPEEVDELKSAGEEFTTNLPSEKDRKIFNTVDQQQVRACVLYVYRIYIIQGLTFNRARERDALINEAR